jgi:hypothetical protein
MRKLLEVLALLSVATVLGGCASLNRLSSDVSTYSMWPAERKPSTYMVERLPSQQTDVQRQQLLENAAHPAMEQAGFTLATDPKNADVSVTLGARVSANERSPFDDPFWWRGGLYGHGFYGRPFYPGFGGPFGWHYYGTPTYEREVALLIRDRRSGKPLYEVRVTNDGYSPSIESLLPAMFEAGMKDFPHGGPNPRRVVTQIGS